jgi:hypothetical protein
MRAIRLDMASYVLDPVSLSYDVMGFGPIDGN